MGLSWEILDIDPCEYGRCSTSTELTKKGRRQGDTEGDENRKDRGKRQNTDYFPPEFSLMHPVVYFIESCCPIKYKSMIRPKSLLSNVLCSRKTILTFSSTTFYNNKGNYLWFMYISRKTSFRIMKNISISKLCSIFSFNGLNCRRNTR